ncbi:MAG: hypothetical protein M3680_24695 [Myxococcota bacterium]|nr:hypothetical protein [Myxococcota bacterium]
MSAPIATAPDPGGVGSRQTSAGACPRGLVWSAGVCREPRADLPHRCKQDDVADCRRQCELGDAGSCSDLGFMHLAGRFVPLDRTRASELFVRACAGDDLHGCNNLGAVLIGRDAVPHADVRHALSLFERACAEEPTLCTNLRACEAGMPEHCVR